MRLYKCKVCQKKLSAIKYETLQKHLIKHKIQTIDTMSYYRRSKVFNDYIGI